MKWVLVRSRLGSLYVLEKEHWVVYDRHAKDVEGAPQTELVAESDNRDELVRFQMLTKES